MGICGTALTLGGGVKSYRWKKYTVTTLLPSGYKPVEFLQSNGTQYIDTGVPFSSANYNKIKLQVDTDITTKAGSYEVIGTGKTNTNCFYVGDYNGTFVYGDGMVDRSTEKAISGRRVYMIDALNGIVSATGIDATSFSPRSPVSALNLALFAYLVATGDVRYHSAKVYSCQIYENGTIIRDFVPCTNASGMAGLYDLVNDVFYANVGSGTFTSGAEIDNIVVGDFVEEVKSLNSNAYPNSGVKDGYYYERVA